MVSLHLWLVAVAVKELRPVTSSFVYVTMRTYVGHISHSLGEGGGHYIALVLYVIQNQRVETEQICVRRVQYLVHTAVADVAIFNGHQTWESALNILKYNVSQNGTSELGGRQRGLDSFENHSFFYMKKV